MVAGKDKQCWSDQEVSQHQQLTKQVRAEYGERDLISPNWAERINILGWFFFPHFLP